MRNRTLVIILVYLAVSAIILSFIPPVEQLGDKIRLVIFHGALSIAGLITIYIAGALGCIYLCLELARSRFKAGGTGLSRSKEVLGLWSKEIGFHSVIVWFIGTMLSLAAMQVAWGGLMWHEPRTVAALTMVFLGLGKEYLVRGNNFFTVAFGNALFAGSVLVIRMTLTFVMHPDNPVGRSDSSVMKQLLMLLIFVTMAAVFELCRRRISSFKQAA